MKKLLSIPSLITIFLISILTLLVCRIVITVLLKNDSVGTTIWSIVFSLCYTLVYVAGFLLALSLIALVIQIFRCRRASK